MHQLPANSRWIPTLGGWISQLGWATPTLLMLQPLPFALGMFHLENDPKHRPNNPRTIKNGCRYSTYIPIYRWCNPIKFPLKHNLDLFLLLKSYEITIFDGFSWSHPHKPTIFSPFFTVKCPGPPGSGLPKTLAGGSSNFATWRP